MPGKKGWTQSETIDWDSIGDAPPPPIDAKKFVRAVIGKAEARSTAKDKPAVSIALNIAEIYNEGPLEPPRTTFDFLMFELTTAFRVKQLVNAIGSDDVKMPKSTGFDDVEAFANSLVGKEVWFKTKLERDRDDPEKKYTRVDCYVPAEKLAEAAGGAVASSDSETQPQPRRRQRQPQS